MSRPKFSEDHPRARSRFRLPPTPTVIGLIFLGVVIHLAGYLGIAGFPSSLKSPPESSGYVSFPVPDDGNLSPLLAERAFLFDSAPLFLPTPQNFVSRQDLRVVSDPALAPLFGDFRSRLLLNELNFDPFRPFRSGERQDVSRFLRSGAWFFFDGFGRTPSQPQPVYPRDGLVRLVRLPGGEQVAERAIQAGAVESLDEVSANWVPFSFQVLVGETGPLGTPLLIGNSGSQRIHDAWRTWLLRDSILFRLAPGYYRIEIGP